MKPLPRRKTMHLLHFVLACLTGFLWVIPWIIFTIYNASYNQKLDLAEAQNPRVRPRRQAGIQCTCEDSPHTYCEACGH